MLHRPEPLLSPRARPVDRHADPTEAAWALSTGESLVVRDNYGTAADILDALQASMPAPPRDAPFAERRAARRDFEAAAHRLLVPIIEHRLDWTGAEPIGFLAELYPELPKFFLPFMQVQDLYGRWQVYIDGVHLPVLGQRIHPFYGTYAPTRMEHLQLFATWLAGYEGPKQSAMDVGTGCGVLTLMLAKSGFVNIRATDSNPNAIESVNREVARRDLAAHIDAVHTDLLGKDPGPTDLIVFNPPWTKGQVRSHLDAALYFEDGLFERFFDQAAQCLAPDGRVVLIFSNIMRLVQPDVPHPIDAELIGARFRLVQKLTRKIKPPPGPDRRRTKEKVEVWELARA